MNKAQEYRKRFPGIKHQNVEYRLGEVRPIRYSRIFSAYQCESQVIECIKDTLTCIGKSRLVSVGIRYGESWYDSSTFHNKDDVVGQLFDYSLAWYITRFSIVNYSDNCFDMEIKMHKLDKLQKKTNIGPNLLEYIGSLFGEKL